MTTTSDTLNKAADLIETHGWGQGYQTWRTDSPAGLCLEGGILAAAGFDVSNGVDPIYEEFKACPAYAAVWAYLETDDRWGMFRQDLYSWNDVHGRTADEVVEVLRAVAVIEAAREQVPAEVSA